MRYSFSNGVHKLWVYATDQPFKYGSPTAPRTELMFLAPHYFGGVWQFEGEFYVPAGTTRVCIMQVFGGKTNATALQIRVDGDGDLIRTGDDLPRLEFATNIYDKWHHLNVVHDIDDDLLYIYLDRKLKHVEANDAYKEHYFKCGVYAQVNASNYMESRWKNIKVWTM